MAARIHTRTSSKNGSVDIERPAIILGTVGEGENSNEGHDTTTSRLKKKLIATLQKADNASDALINKKKLSNYPRRIRMIFAPILKFLVVALLVFLGWYNYTTARSGYFMSMEWDSGDCVQVGRSVSGEFGMDFQGHWEGSVGYNPSRTSYILTLNDFLHTEKDYPNVIRSNRDIIDKVSSGASQRSLTSNLLYWMSWYHEITEHGHVDSLRLSGSVISIFDRFSVQAVLNHGHKYCKVVPVGSYNVLNGVLDVVYSSSAYSSESSCTSISSAENLGYVKEADGDKFALRVDMRSSMTALAVNKGVLRYEHLVDVHISKAEEFTYNSTYTYVVKHKIDSRYPAMKPIVCFKNITMIPLDSHMPHHICVEEIAAVYAYPFFIHKGLGGQGNYSQYSPVPCNCSDGTGKESYCNTFDFLTGAVFFGRTGSTTTSATIMTTTSTDSVSSIQRSRTLNEIDARYLSEDTLFETSRADSESGRVYNTLSTEAGPPQTSSTPNVTPSTPPSNAPAPSASPPSASPPSASPPTSGSGSSGSGPSGGGLSSIGGSGPYPRENQFQSIMDMILRVGGADKIDDAVYYGAFAAVTLGNGKGPSVDMSTLSTADLTAYNLLTNETHHADKYAFCNDECSLLTLNYYDPFRKTINGDAKTLDEGSCYDSFSLSDEAWNYFENPKNTPASLIESYYKCLPFPSQAFLIAAGTTLGMTGAAVVLIGLVVMALATPCGVKQMNNIPEFYDDVTREQVLEELANYLLFVRDGRGGREEDAKFVQHIVETLQYRQLVIEQKIRRMSGVPDDPAHMDALKNAAVERLSQDGKESDNAQNRAAVHPASKYV